MAIDALLMPALKNKTLAIICEILNVKADYDVSELVFFWGTKVKIENTCLKGINSNRTN